MKKILKQLGTIGLIGAILVSAVGCGSKSDKLIVGASPVPHGEILEVVKEQLAQQGIEMEIKEFSDYVLPNNALLGGDISANFFQHTNYLDDFNLANDGDLISAVTVHFEPLGIYAGTETSLENIPEGSKVAIPNDTTNEARALNLLAANGLIVMDEGKGLYATPKDIIENPLKLEFVELAAEQIPNALTEVAIGVINGNHALASGIVDTVIVMEDPSVGASAQDAVNQFANIIAIRPEDKDSDQIKALVAAITSEEVRTFITEKYGALVIPVF